MKKISGIFIFLFLVSCTSNTIFEKPQNLIPSDTMSLLLQEMVIASSAKFMKNKGQQKNINYMPLVYEKFKIDSSRFETSNQYYMSTIDKYQEILEGAKASLGSRNEVFKKIKTRLDSLRKDSIRIARKNQNKLDSVLPKNPKLKKLKKGTDRTIRK
ncbi:DUF4296 domain-containing protein [uncultured Polaribacter sp.]|uniref:DUF4296 domain-containing protein n=1 Tax=uncultured Polaribacter sp. TaxID=174711 RepID=UPI000EC910A4|nr:DUF4296 domain-containing protein [Polaribacter sp.]|tara:strand:+ start:6702 stop:7172 length:471 start_codon:yes stop_codon:yes gene_type:complete